MQPTAEHLARCRLVTDMLDRHAAALALYASAWTTEPEDCVQEALVELAGSPAEPANPVAWLYCVVRRRAMNAARSQRRRTAREQAAWHERLRGNTAGIDRSDLLEAVATLPESRREIVLLKVWGNLTFSEIAEVVESSSSTVHREYENAISELRKLWEVPCEQMTKTK